MLFGKAVWVCVLLFDIDGKNHYQIYNNNITIVIQNLKQNANK